MKTNPFTEGLMAEEKDRVFHLVRYGGISLCAPAVRLVIVHAWAEKNPDGQWISHPRIIPVIALVGTIERRYSARADHRPPDDLLTHADLSRSPWIFREEDLQFECLIDTEDFGLVPAFDPIIRPLEAVNAASEMVACPWPHVEDDERLADAIQRVGSLAIEKARKRWPSGRPSSPLGSQPRG